MKSSWLCYVFLFCLIAATQLVAQAPAAVKAPSMLEQTAIANEKTLIEAKKKDDGAFFKRTLSPDFSLVGVDGRLLEGQEAVDNLGDSGLVELTPYDIKVVALGGDGAIVTYDAIVREAPEEDQGPPPRYQHFSSVWVKHGDQWKLKFHQATAAHWGDW
ncbi:MAG: nuclear transport factor 2 family protein [Candidatus Sulfotelmatobacter sp.]